MNRKLGLSAFGLVLLLSACTQANIKGVKTFSYPAGQHQTSQITYSQTPPAGGPHNPNWQNCGVYDAPLSAPYVVHSLEHSAVSISYRPGPPQIELDVLKKAVKEHTYTLLSPNPDQTSPIVLTAWGAQLSLNEASDARLAAFLKRYEQAKDAPEPGAPCTGGMSTVL